MKSNKATLLNENLAQLELLEFEDILHARTLVDVNIADLIRPNYSSRQLVENQINALKTTLNRFGFLGGIFVEANRYHVIDGWYRVQEWKRMGFITIPCYLLTCTPEQERALHLGLNQQTATFDPSNFGIEFKDFDLKTDYGIDLEDLAFLNKGVQSKFPHAQKQDNEGYTKLSTFLPINAYDRLATIKKDMQAPSMAEAVVNLIKFHDETN